MGHSLLSFIQHTETNNLRSLWQSLNNETGLTVASMGSSVQSHNWNTGGFHSSAICIDHAAGFFFFFASCCRIWLKIPQMVREQWNKGFSKQTMWINIHESARVQVLWTAVNKVSINVLASKFHCSLWNRRRAMPRVCLQNMKVRIDFGAFAREQDSNRCEHNRLSYDESLSPKWMYATQHLGVGTLKTGVTVRVMDFSHFTRVNVFAERL